MLFPHHPRRLPPRAACGRSRFKFLVLGFELRTRTQELKTIPHSAFHIPHSQMGCPVPTPSPDDITTLLRAWGGGDESALARLTPLVYKRLRQIAHAQLRGERQGHILQPTALINEVYVRLLKSAPIDFRDRAHFYALAARAMRRILIDLAKTHQAWIVLDGHHRTSDEKLGHVVERRRDPLFVQIDRGLTKMECEYPRQAAVLELSY